MKPFLCFSLLLVLTPSCVGLEPLAEDEMQSISGQAGVALELGMDVLELGLVTSWNWTWTSWNWT